MVKKSFILFPLLLAAFIVTACNAITIIVDGSGDMITESWEVGNFDSISLSGSGEVILTQREGEFLTVETDDNIMEYIEVDVNNGTLELGFKSGFRSISPTRLVFRVGVDQLNELDVSGSGEIDSDRIESGRLVLSVSGSGGVVIDELMADKVTADISGSGDVKLAGEATVQEVSVSGSGNYKGGDLCSATVKADVSGSGEIIVCATETLDADASGSGSISYYGRPVLNSSTSGSGDITSLGE